MQSIEGGQIFKISYSLQSSLLNGVLLSGAWAAKHTGRPHTQSGQGRIGNNTRMFIRASAKNPVKWTLDKTLGNLSEHCLKILTRWRRRTWSWKVKMVCWDNTLKISCRYRNSCCGLATIYCCNFCFYRPAMCSKQSVPSPGGKKLHQRNRPRQTPKCSLWWKWKWSG